MELLTADEIVRLTPPERLALIGQLWDSLENDQLPLTGAQEAELEHRLTSLDEDRTELIAAHSRQPRSVALAETDLTKGR